MNQKCLDLENDFYTNLYAKFGREVAMARYF